MTIEGDIFTALKALVGNRAFPDFAPAGTATPYLVYQQVGGEEPTFLERAEPSKENARFQITVWSSLRTESKAISKQARAAMVLATAFQAKPLGAAIALIDEDVQPVLRGSSQDFTVWSDR